MRVEEKIQIDIFSYLAAKYPHVIAISEPAGVRVSMGLATKLKKMRSKHTHADVYILEPVGKFSGLVLELKCKNIFKKDGSLYKDGHLEDQQRTLDLLNAKGYYAAFVIGYEAAISLIENYLNNKL